MHRATRLISLFSSSLALALGGCADPAAFTCADDQACEGVGPGAQCEANGYCSFEDEACPDGRRYGDLAGEGLGGACVGAAGVTDGTDGTHGTSIGPASTADDDPSLDDTTTEGGQTSATEDSGPPVLEEWWDCGWAERRALTLDVPDTGEVLTNVPVLVVLDASRIDASIMAPDGRDLRFVAEDGTTVLSHELEQWSPEGLSWAWVQLPELHAGIHHLSMYYGNPPAPLLPGADVWSGYAGVWHMGFELADASGIHAPGEGMAATATGQAGPAQGFAPPTDGMRVLPAAPVDGLFAQGGTITAMIRPSGWGGDWQGLVVRRADSSNGDGGWVLAVDGDRQALRFARGFTMNRRTWYTADQSLALHAWHHVAVVYQDDPLGNPTLYVDGVPQELSAQGMTNGSPEPDDAPELHIGGLPGTTAQTFDGLIDEVRVAAVPRSAAWMTVQVASLHDDLAQYGAPQSSPCE